ncbi:MAG TPA: PIG-L family deacetylase [Dokdonella sp.]|nr:PIG-L family deacetylase [Dokdonella sp.]
MSKTAGIEFRHSERLLVVIPHPDDETLATGGLIQVALAAGLPLRVLVATDGDNNPWPQRWLEKRWRIGAADQARWGARRREEARLALSLLGVSDQAVRFLGWPDQGLTDMLLRDSSADETLAAEIRQFSPTILAMPSLSDRHPDHSALRVMLELALASTRPPKCRKLGYLVHGKRIDESGLSLQLDGAQQRAKQRALLAHATQLSLSRRRMRALCERVEQFEAEWGEPEPVAEAGRMSWDMPWSREARWLRRHELLLVLGNSRRSARARLALSQREGAMRTTIGIADGSPVEVEVMVRSDSLSVSLAFHERLQFAYVKIDRVGPRLVIYDSLGWNDACAYVRGGPEQSLQTSTAAGR